MTSADYETLLTPAARQLLQQLTEDIRQQLLADAALNSLRATGFLREISVSDVARSYSRTQSGGRPTHASPVDRVLEVYKIGGIGLAVLGLVGMLLGHYVSEPTVLGRPDVVGAVSLSGLAISVFAYAMQRRRIMLKLFRRFESSRDDVSAPTQLLGDFLMRWVELEVAIKAVAAESLGESAANMPLLALVKALQTDGTLGQADAETVRGLLSLRNETIHGGSLPSAETARHGLEQASQVLDRIGHRQTRTLWRSRE